MQVKATVLSNGHNWVRLCKSTRFDGNAGDHWSDNNPSLDTFGNAAGILTVVVEFCAGARGDRAVVRYCRPEYETSVLQMRKILVLKHSTYDFRQQRNVTVVFDSRVEF